MLNPSWPDMPTFTKTADPQQAVAEAPSTVDALRAQNAELRSELELLREALERMPHGMCAFDGQDRLLLANAHYGISGHCPMPWCAAAPPFARSWT